MRWLVCNAHFFPYTILTLKSVIVNGTMVLWEKVGDATVERVGFSRRNAREPLLSGAQTSDFLKNSEVFRR